MTNNKIRTQTDRCEALQHAEKKKDEFNDMDFSDFDPEVFISLLAPLDSSFLKAQLRMIGWVDLLRPHSRHHNRRGLLLGVL